MVINNLHSKSLNVSRILAILFVISAHISVPNENVNRVLAITGSMGVGIFMYISGYLFNRNKKMAVFFLEKSQKIVIPWIVSGVLVYLYVAIMKGESISIVNLVLWCMGYKTYLYFLTILMLFFVVFYKIKSRMLLYISIVLNLVSVTMTQFGLMDNIIEVLHITNYLNPLNFIGFFAIGILCQQIDSKQIYSVLYKFRYYSIVILIIITLIIYISGQSGYFRLLTHCLEYLVIFSSMSTSTLLVKCNLSVLSKYSFAIYLYHMPFVGILAKVYTINIVTMLLAPCIVFLVVAGVLIVFDKLSSLIGLNGLYKKAIGVR